MTEPLGDLNAPLQPRSPRSERTRRTAQDAGGNRTFGLIAACALALVGLNIYAVTQTHKVASAPPITLPEPIETAAIAVSEPEPAAAAQNDSGVTVLYGNDSDTNLDITVPDDNPPVPQARPESPERLISPGGPKVITIRDPAAANIGQPIQLAHLPEDAAMQEGADGLLPIKTPEGRRPMDIYARPWSPGAGKRIALVIGGIGLSQTGTQRAIEMLPPEVTLGFSPLGNSLNRWMREARKKGHELVVQIPMEPFGYPDIDPGPRTLRLASSEQTNIENLHWALSRTTNYTGIMNYLGGRLATDRNALAPILDDLSKRGLLLLNDGSVSAGLGNLARDKGVPYAQADVVIDSSMSQGDILAKLKSLEDLATSRGYAVGTGSALALTVETVSKWANDAKKRGFEFVGASAIVQTAGR